jgi:hypothetical protein
VKKLYCIKRSSGIIKDVNSFFSKEEAAKWYLSERRQYPGIFKDSVLVELSELCSYGYEDIKQTAGVRASE